MSNKEVVPEKKSTDVYAELVVGMSPSTDLPTLKPVVLDPFAVVEQESPTPIPTVASDGVRIFKPMGHFGAKLSDVPKVIIGNVEMKLEKMASDEAPGAHTYCRDRPTSGMKTHYLGFSSSYIDNFEEACSKMKQLTFYYCKVNGVEIVISQGSTVILENINTYREFEFPGPKKLIVVASVIKGNTLTIGERVTVIGSMINTKYGTLDRSKLNRTGVDAKQSSSFMNSTLINCKFTAGNLTARGSLPVNVEINGFETIEMFDTSSYSYSGEEFLITNWCGNPQPGTAVLIENVTLAPFRFAGSIPDRTSLRINKRIDYGLLNGLEPIPFIAEFNGGIIIPNYAFTPKEILREEPAMARSKIKGRDCFDYKDEHDDAQSKKDALYIKVRKMMFGLKHSSAYDPSYGMRLPPEFDNVVTSLIDQITSRVKLLGTYKLMMFSTQRMDHDDFDI